MDGCQSKEIVPFYPKLGGWGGGKRYMVARAGKAVPSPPHLV